ncbi:hypothetical protein [Azospirillum sp. ST 5-10]|uniref:hypothetical protein n=1 Tax=unclassified Azospirillum TaxID=2630922 RepID=UPI003F4A2538
METQAMGTEHEAMPHGGQPLLFDSLPEAEPPPGRRQRAGRPRRSANAAAAVAVDAVREPAPRPVGPLAAAPPRPAAAAPSPQTVMALPPAAAAATPAVFDPASLTNPELRALVQALPDARLAHLLVEAARELKRRVVPDGWDEAEDGPFEPDRALLRAAAQAVGELSGEDA